MNNINRELLWQFGNKKNNYSKQTKTYEIFNKILDYIENKSEWQVCSIDINRQPESIDYEKGTYIWLEKFLKQCLSFSNLRLEALSPEHQWFISFDTYSLYGQMLPYDNFNLQKAMVTKTFNTYIKPYSYIQKDLLKQSYLKNKDLYLELYNLVIENKNLYMLNQISDDIIDRLLHPQSPQTFEDKNFKQTKKVNWSFNKNKKYKNAYIYAICINNKVVYVGQSHRSNYQRLLDHVYCSEGERKYSSSKSHLYNQMSKKGYQFRILFQGQVNQTQLDAMQLGFITYFKPMYNMEGRGLAFRFVEDDNSEVYSGQIITRQDLRKEQFQFNF